jgi:hypothetical protein
VALPATGSKDHSGEISSHVFLSKESLKIFERFNYKLSENVEFSYKIGVPNDTKQTQFSHKKYPTPI